MMERDSGLGTRPRHPRVPSSQSRVPTQSGSIAQVLFAPLNAVRLIRNVKHQLEERSKRATGATAAQVAGASEALAKRLSAIEGEIYQVRNRSRQDPLNYPIKLNNKIAALAGVVASGDYKPTAQSYEVFRELSTELDRELARLRTVLDTELQKVNAMLAEAKLPAVVPSTAEVAEKKWQVSEGGGG